MPPEPTTTPANDDANTQPEGETQQGEQEWTFDSWYDSQEDRVKAGFEGRTAKLKSALDSERKGRGDLEKQVKALSKGAEEGSELRTQLEKLSGELATERVRADFYEKAPADCSNPKGAFILARSDGFIDKDGEVNWKGLKQQYPEFFAAQTPPRRPPPSNAGQGNGGAQKPQVTKSMDNFIRQSTGRGIEE